MPLPETSQIRAIAEAIEFIERNLDQELSSEMVASHVGFSTYYFHRVFTGVLGESIAEYIRKRRLSESAQLVRSSDQALLDVALMYGFDSQESFTRAFKKMFGVTPGRYRSMRNLTPYPEKVRATAEMLEHLQGGITMHPKIITRDAELVVGMGGVFQQGDSEAIGQLWDRFQPRMTEVPKSAPYAIGACMAKHPKIEISSGDQFVYISALPVDSTATIPDGMVSAELPAGRYAVFTHKGPISEIKHTLTYIWGTWMPKGEYERRDAPDFELYDDRFNPQSADSEFDFYIPIR